MKSFYIFDDIFDDIFLQNQGYMQLTGTSVPAGSLTASKKVEFITQSLMQRVAGYCWGFVVVLTFGAHSTYLMLYHHPQRHEITNETPYWASASFLEISLSEPTA